MAHIGHDYWDFMALGDENIRQHTQKQNAYLVLRAKNLQKQNANRITVGVLFSLLLAQTREAQINSQLAAGKYQNPACSLALKAIAEYEKRHKNP